MKNLKQAKLISSVVLAATLISSQAAHGQLLVKETPDAETALYSADKRTLGRDVPIYINTGPVEEKSIARIWKSGYAGTTTKDRVTFALAYDKWERENGEDETKLDPMLPYSMRLNWAKQWWSKYTVAFDKEHATAAVPDPWSDWARESVLDAGILLALVKKDLNQSDGDNLTRDKIEIKCVWGKREDMIRKEVPLKHPPMDRTKGLPKDRR